MKCENVTRTNKALLEFQQMLIFAFRVIFKENSGMSHMD